MERAFLRKGFEDVPPEPLKLIDDLVVNKDCHASIINGDHAINLANYFQNQNNLK
jgi:hypothetical protein